MTGGKHDNPITIKEITQDDSHQEYPSSDIASLFPILAYSQGEGMSIARDAIKQLELIDSHLDISKRKKKIELLRRSLRINTGELKIIDERLGDLEGLQNDKKLLEREISEIQDNLNKIKAIQEEPAIRNHQKWEDESAYFKRAIDGLQQLKEKLLGIFDPKDLPFQDVGHNFPSNDLGNDEELSAVREIASKTQSYIQDLKQKIEADFDRMRAEIEQEFKKWQSKYNEHKKEREAAMKRSGDLVSIRKLPYP